MLTRLVALMVLAAGLSACSSSDPADDPVDAFTVTLAELDVIDGFAGIALDGDAVTVYVTGESPEALEAARAVLGERAAVSVTALPTPGRGSESIKSSVGRAVPDWISIDYQETIGYVQVGMRTADGLRRGKVITRAMGFGPESVLFHIARPIQPFY